MQKGRLELNRTFGFLKRAGALVLSAVMSLSLCAPATMAAEAPAQDAAEYACGLQEHSHDASCRVVDPVGDLLASSNYQDGYGVVYIVHQHDAACFDGGRLACVLMDGQYMAGYLDVSVVHKHDEGCTGCTLPSEPYRIGDPAVNRPGAATSNGQVSGPDGDIYIGTGIGAGKDTGDTGVDDDTRAFQFHNHTDCGGDCDLPFVVRYVASASDWEGRIVCGLAEHTHSTTCRKPAAVDKTPVFPSMPSILQSAALERTSTPSRQTGATAYFVPRAIVSKAYKQGPDLPAEGWGWTLSSNSNPSVIMPVASGDGWTVNGDGSVSVAARAGAESVWPRIEFSKAGEYEFHISCSTTPRRDGGFLFADGWTLRVAVTGSAGNWSVSGQYVLDDAAEAKPRTDRAEARVMAPGFGGFDANTINRATRLVDEMTAGERAGQLFLAHWPGSVDNAKAMVDNYHVGGFLTFGSFYESLTPELARSNIMSVQYHTVDNGGTPLLFTTDEEGGNVTRVSKHPKYRTRPFDAASVVKSGGEAGIKRDGLEKALFLRSLGLNVNHAPVADMAEAGSYVWERTYKAGTADTARYIASAVRGLEQGHIGSTMKHFPGYGKSPDDTHGGAVADSRTRNDLLYNDLIPFYAGMHSGGHSVMVSHTTMGGLGDSIPASLSPSVYSILRDDLGFWGVAMTDDLCMGAVPAGGNSALAALEAGADMVICSNVEDGYTAVTGKMASDAAFASSVKDKCTRVVAWKLSMGLMDADWDKTPEARYQSSDGVTDIVGPLNDIMAFADGGSGTVTLLVDCDTESAFSFGTNTNLTIDLAGHVLHYMRESGGSLLRIHSQADVRIVGGGAGPVDVLSTGFTGWDAHDEILRYSSGFWDNGQIHVASFGGMGRIEATGVGHWNNAVLVCESGGSKLSLENVHLSGNNRHTSAAIRQSGGITTVRLSGCVISGFKESGIQASCWKPASLSVSGSYIIGNEGYAGAGIRAENTKLHISDTVMAYNSAIGNGGGSGGGMDIRFTDEYGGRFNKDAVHIENCVFFRNSAISNGGGVCIGNCTVNDVKFSGRTAIIGNSAEKDGGGIWYFKSERTSPGQVSRLSLTGETDISENVASVIGGGIYADVRFDEGFQLVMDGNDVRIQRNRADGFGLNAGGVFLDVMWRSVVLGGKVQVTGNTLSDKNTTVSAKNIRLSDGTICEISRELDPASRISVFTESTKPSIVVASSSVGDVSQELMNRVFVPEREGYKVIGKDTELLFTTGQSFEVPVSMIVDGLVANVGTVSGTYSGGKAYMSFPDVKDFFLPYEIDCVMADGNTHSFGIMDAGSGSDGALVSVVSSQVVAGDDDQLCVSAGDLLGKRLVYLPNFAAVGSYSYEDMVRTNGFWSVTVRDMLGVIDDTVEDLSKTYYVPSGRGIDLRLPYQKNDRWSWKVEGDVDAFTCDREVDGDHENVVLSDIRTPVTVTRFVMDGAVYTAQYYAYSESIASALSDVPNASPVVDTRGKNVPVNDVNFSPDLLYLRIGASGEVMRNAELKPFYESSRFAYAAAPSLMYADRLYTNGRYETTQLWVLKPGHFAGSVDSEDWDIYDRDALGLDSIHDLALTNDPNSAVDGETIYLWDGATIRFVYEPASGFSDSPVGLYDWDVGYNSTRASINDELYEMQGSARLAVTNDKSCVKDKSIAEASVPGIGGNFYINRRARNLDETDPNYDTLNKSKWWQANYGLLSGTTETGLPIWRNGVVAVNLLGPDSDGNDTPGKTEVENASARFVRNGDLYTMDSVAVTLFDDGKAYEEIRKGGLSSFQHPGPYVSIWTNDFYPLDDLPGYITGRDPKYGGSDTVVDKMSPCVSDDGRAHNMFFGMRFRIKFSLPEDYLGDLEYCFYGNETYVVLDQKTVVADLGGVHVSFGQYVDLWDYIEKGDTKEHTLDVIVMDRGGAGSTSWIQFMIPDATFERVSYDNTSSVEVSKAVTGNPVFAKESYQFDVTFTGSSEDPLVSDVTGTVYNADDTVESTCVISNGNGSLLLKDGQRVVFDGISALTGWSVREASYSDCITSVSVDSDGDMEAGSTGSLSASGLAKAGGGNAVVAYTNSFDNIGNEMPKTGGMGTAMIVVAGLSCLAGAAVLAVRRRGRR